MDPLSLSTSVAGLLSLTIELSKILKGYVDDIRSAHQEATELMTEVSTLEHVLDMLDKAFRDKDPILTPCDEKSALKCMLDACRDHVKAIDGRLEGLKQAKASTHSTNTDNKKNKRMKLTTKVASIGARFAWPFGKGECHRNVQILHRYIQVLHMTFPIGMLQ